MRNEKCHEIQPAEVQKAWRSVLCHRAEKGRVVAGRGRSGLYTLVEVLSGGRQDHVFGSQVCQQSPWDSAPGREAAVMLLICQVIITAGERTVTVALEVEGGGR